MHKRKNITRLLTQEQEEPNKHNGFVIESKDGNNNNNLTIDQEIECPRCYDIMTLYSDFNRLCYVCECTLYV
jgi:hypothetical protein